MEISQDGVTNVMGYAVETLLATFWDEGIAKTRIVTTETQQATFYEEWWLECPAQ
jgi:hypothetical protein